MSNNTLKLSDTKVLTEAHAVLRQHLPLEADGYVCTTDTLLDALLGVAVNRGTLERVCTDWLHLPNAETVRGYLNDQLCIEDLPELERRLNAALAAQTPARVKRAPQELACDFTDRPYYGKAPQDQALWVRGRAKDGTTRFYRIATAYVIHKHMRVTLALHFVLPGEDALTVLQSLLKRLAYRGIRITCLYLDKGFASIKVMRYLLTRQQPAVIACPIRGKQHGTRALCQGVRSYNTTYTFESAEEGTCTVPLAICRTFTTARRTKRLKRRATWLIYIVLHLELSLKQVRRRYRRRFGIESSYRLAGAVRGWTTSPNPAYRFVLLALSFILLNIWLRLRWVYAQVARRGRRALQTRQFQLFRFVKFLLRALERCYGCVTEIQASALPIT